MGSKWEEKWGVFSKCEKSELQSYSYAFPIKPTIRQPEFLHVDHPRKFAEGEKTVR